VHAGRLFLVRSRRAMCGEHDADRHDDEYPEDMIE
jgi:hypothetical protein